MLRALGFGCCASAPFDGFFVFLDAVLRTASCTPIATRETIDADFAATLLGLQQQGCVLHRCDCTEEPAAARTSPGELQTLQNHRAKASSRNTLSCSRAARLTSVLLPLAIIRAPRRAKRTPWTYRPRQSLRATGTDRCDTSRRAVSLPDASTSQEPLHDRSALLPRARLRTSRGTAPRDRSALAQPLRTRRLASQAPGRE